MRIPDLPGDNPVSRWTSELSRVLSHAFRAIDHTLESLARDIALLNSPVPLSSHPLGDLPDPNPDGQHILAVDDADRAVAAFSWRGQWYRISDGEPL
jgi:hypothetical protein